MLIIMGGPPFVGKSTFLNFLKDCVSVIDPKEFLVPEHEKLNSEEKLNAQISAWECAMELLDEKVKSSKNGDIIVFDTAASSADPILERIKIARKYGHRVMYVFVMAELSKCKERAGDRWIGDDVMSRYKDKFINSIPIIKRASDEFRKIDNNGDLFELEEMARAFKDCLTLNSNLSIQTNTA